MNGRRAWVVALAVCAFARPASAQPSFVPAPGVLFELSRQEVPVPESISIRDPHPIGVAIGLFIAANVADTAITYHLIAKHGTVVHESNPLLAPLEKRPGALALTKSGLAVLTSYLLVKEHKKHPRTTFWIALAGAGAYSTIAALNWRYNP